MLRGLVAYFSPWALTSTLRASATPNVVTVSVSLSIALFMEKRFHSLQEVGLLPVGPRKVFYFPSTIHWEPMEAFLPYPPPGDAPSRGYRLPRGNNLI
ncbi:hypothetical protein TNCV_3052621 [Trichonephila clavipes]|nr:hypothetical protein TNCV_3052621 [Trichonephila clavipes]